MKRELPDTSFAILGLLARGGEMSGYDVGKAVSGSVAYFFSPAKSHIYAELRRLVAAGYAAERVVRQTGRPNKRLYRATRPGVRALQTWLAASDDEPATFKSPFLLKLFFGQFADRDTLLAKLRAFRKREAETLAALRAIEAAIAGVPQASFPYLTVTCGLAHTRASLRWCDDVARKIDEGSAS